MNRQIKFRGKRFPNGEWVYGHIFQTPVGEWKIKKGFREYLVNPDTVGQFTGLLDHNGKEIYEGDIVRDNWDSIGIVIFYHGEWRVDWGCGDIHTLYDLLGDKIVIVGNRFDNPELLKGGDYGRNS